HAQIVCQTYDVAQADIPGPTLQRPIASVVGKAQGDGVALFFDAQQLPVQRAYKTVGRRLLQLIVRLHRLRIAPQIAEPGPANRHTTAHALPGSIGRVRAQPDQRWLLVLSVTEYLRTLLGHQQFAACNTNSPAGQLIQFHAFDLGSAHYDLSLRWITGSVTRQEAKRPSQGRASADCKL